MNDDKMVPVFEAQVIMNWSVMYAITSSGACEMLRESGCIKLPTQRTLRDYTYHVKASTGSSSRVDQMVIDAFELKLCPERDKCAIILIDEMHIRQVLVFDKSSGKMIGFANLAITLLINFEQEEAPKFQSAGQSWSAGLRSRLAGMPGLKPISLIFESYFECGDKRPLH